MHRLSGTSGPLYIWLPLTSVVVQSLSQVWLFATPWTQHIRLPCPSPSPGVCSNSYPSSQGCYLTISSSIVPISCPQSSPASGSFPISQLFASGSQSMGASASVLSLNIQGWFPLGWTGLISLLSKRLSRVFSNTTIQKHQFCSAQPFFMVSHLYVTALSAKWCLYFLMCCLGLSELFFQEANVF